MPLNSINIDFLIEQIKTISRGTSKVEKNTIRQTFTFLTPLNLKENGKWLSGLSSFQPYKNNSDITEITKKTS